MQDKDIVEVYSAANEPEAHLVKSLLENAGIQARVVGENLCGVAGDVPPGLNTEPRIWVTRADSERARQIIAEQETEYRTGKASSSLPPWTCPHCSQEVPGTFDVCWKCEYSRAAT